MSKSLLALLLLSAMASSLQAEIITYRFTGAIDTPNASDFNAGDSVYFDLTIDNAVAADYCIGGNECTYVAAVVDISGQIGGVDLTVNNLHQPGIMGLDVVNDSYHAGAAYDFISYGVVDVDLTGIIELGSYGVESFGFSVSDGMGNAFESALLQNDFTNFDLAAATTTNFFHINFDSSAASGAFTSIRVVPLPGAFWLALSGFALMFGVARKKAAVAV